MKRYKTCFPREEAHLLTDSEHSDQLCSLLMSGATKKRRRHNECCRVLQHKEVTDKEGDKTEGPDLTDGAVN